MTDVRDLGPIEGRVVEPGWSAPPPPPPPPGPPPPPAPPPTAGPPPQPAAATAATAAPVSSVGLRTSPVDAARAAAVQAARDVREAHRRGPKPNSRPVPDWVRRLAWFLDDAVPVPGTGGRRVGVDGFIGFVPVVGDAAGVALSMVVVLAGIGAGVSIPTVIRMMLNVAFEGVVGLVPVAGTVFDLVYKANDRNVRLIERDLADRRATRRSSLGVVAIAGLSVVVSVLMMVAFTALSVLATLWVLGRIFG